MLVLGQVAFVLCFFILRAKRGLCKQLGQATYRFSFLFCRSESRSISQLRGKRVPGQGPTRGLECHAFARMRQDNRTLPAAHARAVAVLGVGMSLLGGSRPWGNGSVPR